MEKNRRKVWFALCLNLIMMALYLLIMRPKFDSNDDMNLAFFINRARPIQDPHLLFVNYMIGCVLAFLYRITVMLPWYGLLQYAVLLAGFTAAVWVIEQCFGNWESFALSMIVLNLFAADAYINVQFTKTAGIGAACGIMLLIWSMEQEKISKWGVAAGVLIALCGYMWRDREAYPVLVIWCVYGLYLLICLPRRAKGTRFRKALVYFGCLLILGGVWAGAHAVDEVSYKTSPDASAYRDINDVRSTLTDFGFPDYESNRQLYESLGIKESAYKLFSKWNFYDPDVFTLDVQKSLQEVQNHRKWDLALIRGFFDTYPYKWFQNPMFYGWLLMLVLVVFFGRRMKETLIAVLVEIVLLLMIFLYMYQQGRYNLERVDSPLWLAASLVLLMLLDRYLVRFEAKIAGVLILVVLAMNQNVWRASWRHNTRDDAQKMAVSRNQNAQVANDTEHLYLAKAGLYTLSVDYSPLSLVPVNVASNTAVTGGWPAGSPAYKAVLEKYGITNPFRDCVNNEKVYFIDNHPDITLQYIREYYYPDAVFEDKGDFNGNHIYYFHTP